MLEVGQELFFLFEKLEVLSKLLLVFLGVEEGLSFEGGSVDVEGLIPSDGERIISHS